MYRRRCESRCSSKPKMHQKQKINTIMAKNDFQHGGWNYYTLQCGMWLWNRDSEFTKWQHPAMWYVALGWHAIGFAKRLPYWNSTSGFHFHTSPQSTCYSVPVCEILSKSDHRRQKKMTSCRFSIWRISAILDCRDLIIVSLKSPIT